MAEQKLLPCPKCGQVPMLGYACGEYFILSIDKPVGVCVCGSFCEMHSSKEQEVEAWNRRVADDRK